MLIFLKGKGQNEGKEVISTISAYLNEENRLIRIRKLE
uniref:Calcium-dependent protein kinase, isoform AK1 n=1 Tax=Arundo donax TaxID=35708 RepID=A0A0A9BKH9_ARUDO